MKATMGLCALGVLAMGSGAWRARAAGTEGPTPRAAVVEARRASDDERAHSIFHVGVGLQAFPAAKVCPDVTEVCEPGETSFALSVQNLGRLGDFGLGAGVSWAFGMRPGQSSRGDPDGALERRHSRSYFVVEGLLRYYLPTFHSWEWWVGASLGGVVLSDSWSTQDDREPYADTQLVGPDALTVRTEGLTVGLGAGGYWRFADRWLFGTRLGYANWVFPQERELTPLGDAASLAGRVDIFDLGLVVGFRINP